MLPAGSGSGSGFGSGSLALWPRAPPPVLLSAGPRPPARIPSPPVGKRTPIGCLIFLSAGAPHQLGYLVLLSAGVPPPTRMPTALPAYACAPPKKNINY